MPVCDLGTNYVHSITVLRNPSQCLAWKLIFKSQVQPHVVRIFSHNISHSLSSCCCRFCCCCCSSIMHFRYACGLDECTATISQFPKSKINSYRNCLFSPILTCLFNDTQIPIQFTHKQLRFPSLSCVFLDAVQMRISPFQCNIAWVFLTEHREKVVVVGQQINPPLVALLHKLEFFWSGTPLELLHAVQCMNRFADGCQEEIFDAYGMNIFLILDLVTGMTFNILQSWIGTIEESSTKKGKRSRSPTMQSNYFLTVNAIKMEPNLLHNDVSTMAYCDILRPSSSSSSAWRDFLTGMECASHLRVHEPHRLLDEQSLFSLLNRAS